MQLRHDISCIDPRENEAGNDLPLLIIQIDFAYSYRLLDVNCIA